MTHVLSLVVGCFHKYGLRTIIYTIWWTLYIIIFQCVFINERIWQRGRKGGGAVLFKREPNESATRSEEEFVITHSHLLFAAVAPLAASEFKKTLENNNYVV
jgi:hypothetical protein